MTGTAGPQKAKIMNSRLHNKRRGSRWNLLKNHRKERICDSAEKYGWLSLTKTQAPNSCSWNFSLCTEPRGLPLQIQVQGGVGHNRCKGLLIRVSRASAFLAGSSLDSCGGPSLPCPLPSRPRPLLTGHHRHWGPLLKHLHSLTNSFPVNFLQNHVDTPRESLC